MPRPIHALRTLRMAMRTPIARLWCGSGERYSAPAVQIEGSRVSGGYNACQLVAGLLDQLCGSESNSRLYLSMSWANTVFEIELTGAHVYTVCCALNYSAVIGEDSG